MQAKVRNEYRPIEAQLFGEYMGLRANTKSFELRVRLGDMNEAIKAQFGSATARQVYKPMLQWVDGIAWNTDGSVSLIECKVFAKTLQPVIQLQSYGMLYRKTPRFAAETREPLKELIAGLFSPIVSSAAAGMGIRCVCYRPKWLLPVLLSRYAVDAYGPQPVPIEVR